MPEVAGSVAIVEGQAAAAAQRAESAPAPVATAPAGMSFVDADESGDPAAKILDEVLAGEPAEATETPEGEQPTEAKPEEKPTEPAKTEPAKEETPPNEVEAARLRKGFAKLADERQKVVELQNQARAATASAQQYAEKARKHDELLQSIDKDPAGFLLAHGGDTLVQKALQGFIDQEKSPAEREIAKFRAEQADRDRAQADRERTANIERWKSGVIDKVTADERFDLVNSLGLHDAVIGVITGYAEKYSERDAKGEITKLAELPWDTAAQAVEDQRAQMLEKSKRYGKRTPAAAATTPPKKDAPPAKSQPATAKKAPTSLSSVPVADEPSDEEDLPTDPDERERQLLKQLGF